MTTIKHFVILLLSIPAMVCHAEDGHQLWLRTQKAKPVQIKSSVRSAMVAIAMKELQQSWQGTAGATVTLSIKSDKAIKWDGFRLGTNSIQANTDQGLLNGAYELLRRQQTRQSIKNEVVNPSYERRILNHWDNPNGSIEHGFAGNSIFWHFGKDSLKVTDAEKARWEAYARANASVGINGTVLNNVNASHLIISPAYLQKVKTIAEVLRPYGVKTYLSLKFSSPILLGKLKTADPLDPQVQKWWNDKAAEIYKLIPDFGGFLVKANSEGQPGPQDYGRTHADGANMLADAVKPFNGIVMWRAFVYNSNDEDRAKQAYNEFVPFDGKFRDNVIIQVKNGPIDFQPREPFSPLFGAMKKTPLMAEFQIMQEYLGHAVHLAYLAPMWTEFFNSDTYQQGKGSTVVRSTDGSMYPQKLTAIAGVSNIGLDANWCGHHFGQSNWYAFGRLAWNHQLTSEQIADEWIKLTFSDISSVSKETSIASADWRTNFLTPVSKMMLESREAIVDYMMPLGLHHLFSGNEHYGPGPWWAPKRVRKDWTPPYYHKADSLGIGFDRTSTGSNAVSQYHEPLQSQWASPKTCPESLLLWFHHLPWDYKMKNGSSLWDELCVRYDTGVKSVHRFQKVWDTVQPYVDTERFDAVKTKLLYQSRNAQVWKDGCLLYFQQFSKRPFPSTVTPPQHTLEKLIENDLKRPLDYTR